MPLVKNCKLIKENVNYLTANSDTDEYLAVAFLFRCIHNTWFSVKMSSESSLEHLTWAISPPLSGGLLILSECFVEDLRQVVFILLMLRWSILPLNILVIKYHNNYTILILVYLGEYFVEMITTIVGCWLAVYLW